MRQDFDNGKYTVIFDEKTGQLSALRYGKPWRDLTGDNLILAMLQATDSMRNKFDHLIKESQRHARTVHAP